MRITAMLKCSVQAALVVGAWCAVSGPAAAGVRVADSHYKLATVVKDTTFAGVNGAVIGGDGALYVVHTGDGTVGSGATAVELPTPMYVEANGDIYLATEGRGVISLKYTTSR
jgi:hypothetical protein